MEKFKSYVWSLLPYGVVVKNDRIDSGYCCRVNEIQLGKYLDSSRIADTKVYLRPMSDMTDEEMNTLLHLDNGLLINKDMLRDEILSVKYLPDAIDYLNSRFLDYRGYISLGRAEPAPEGMYKFK